MLNLLNAQSPQFSISPNGSAPQMDLRRCISQGPIHQSPFLRCPLRCKSRLPRPSRSPASSPVPAWRPQISPMQPHVKKSVRRSDRSITADFRVKHGEGVQRPAGACFILKAFDGAALICVGPLAILHRPTSPGSLMVSTSRDKSRHPKAKSPQERNCFPESLPPCHSNRGPSLRHSRLHQSRLDCNRLSHSRKHPAAAYCPNSSCARQTQTLPRNHACACPTSLCLLPLLQLCAGFASDRPQWL